MLGVVVVATRESVALLLLLISPFQHHITKGHDQSRAVSTEVAVQLLGGEAVVEAVDDVVGDDVGDGGACVEKPLDVRPQGLATFFFTQA